MRTAVKPAQQQLLLKQFNGVVGIIVELGVDWGVTTQALASRFPKRQILAIDNWDPKYHETIMPDGEVSTAEDKCAAATRLQTKHDNLQVIKFDVVEYGRFFRGVIGCIFFDAAHEEEGLLREFAVWIPHIHEGGVAVIHDANKLGVVRACDRAFTGHFYKHGVCVWDRRRGAEFKGT